MRLVEKLQTCLDLRGYGFADASELIQKIFKFVVIALILWNVLYAEFKFGNENRDALPWYIILPVLFVGTVIPLCNLLLGREDYELTRLRETLQIHRFCIFLGTYRELGREATVKWIMKITDRYHSMFEGVLISLETGREAPWERLAEEGNRHAKTRILNVMWTRIFEHIREMDVYDNSASEDLLKSQFEYADKVCYEEIARLEQKRIFVCKVIAYLPIFCTIIFYMIYPFVLEGLKLLNTYAEEMQTLGLN